MANKCGSASRPTFKQDFFRLVDARVEVAGRIMPGCDRKEYESYSAKHSRQYGEICRRLGEGDKGLLADFDFTAEALAAFDADNAYTGLCRRDDFYGAVQEGVVYLGNSRYLGY